MLGIVLAIGDSEVKKTEMILTFPLARSLRFILNHLH